MKEMTRDLAAEQARRQASRKVTVAPQAGLTPMRELPNLIPVKATTVTEVWIVNGKTRKRRVNK